MTEQERIQSFDKKVMEYQGKKNFGVGKGSPGFVVTEVLALLFMLIPMERMGGEDVILVLVQGLAMGISGYFYMNWMFALTMEGKTVSWKTYLKYIPVDWEAFRHQRYRVLLQYTGCMFLCFAVLQVFSQIVGMLLLHNSFHLGGVVYAAVMCVLFILLPGLLRIARWT